MTLEAQLSSIPLLAGLEEPTRRRLAQIGKRRMYEPGDVIIKEGAGGTALYVILSGSVRVERGGQTVGQLGSNDFFGELALIEEEPRSASIVAVDRTECLLFPTWEFRALLDEHPELAVPIMRALIERLHRAERHGG